jgi:hypothetical protein
MHEHGFDADKLLWFAGWLVAVVALFVAALRIPLQSRYARWRGWLYTAGVVAAGLGVAVLANVAVLLHDAHLDLTRERVYTPSAAAMRAIDQLSQPVALTYFYRSQDPVGRRTRDLLQVMGRRNPMLTVTAVDPDKEPTLARTQGIKFYNAAVIEAEGRRVLVQSTDEAEIAVGIQRVLRHRVITACFLEGHGELPMDSMEFHTHLESVADHNHGEASSQVIEAPGHGIGRLRRALEAQGYDARKLILATARTGVPADCTVLIAASPRTTFLPAESAALRAYLAAGGSALLLFDLGFVLEPELERLVAELGVRAEQQVVVDPLSHYLNDAEMVAVTGYDPHPITRTLSLTFYPGIRPLTLLPQGADRTVTPMLLSSRDSYVRRVEPVQARAVRLAQAEGTASGGAPSPTPEPGPRVLGVAAEGRLNGGAESFRAIVVGDGDFASNSFFPYMSNSDLLLAMVRWLAREERTTVVATRIPVPPLILLTAQQMRIVFILLVIVLPLAVVVLGGVAWWRRR